VRRFSGRQDSALSGMGYLTLCVERRRRGEGKGGMIVPEFRRLFPKWNLGSTFGQTQGRIRWRFE
jgi:hypothetical protein